MILQRHLTDLFDRAEITASPNHLAEQMIPGHALVEAPSIHRLANDGLRWP